LYGLDSGIIRKIYLFGAILTVMAFAICQNLLGIDLAVGVLIGGTFGILNTWLIELLVKDWLTPEKRDKRRLLIAFAIKFPIILAIGFIALGSGWINLEGFAVGFTVFIVSIVFAALFNQSFISLIGRREPFTGGVEKR